MRLNPASVAYCSRPYQSETNTTSNQSCFQCGEFDERQILLAAISLCSCAAPPKTTNVDIVKPDYVIAAGQEHFAFSRAIPAVIRVPDGAIVEAHTREASNGLIRPGTTNEEFRQFDWPEEFGHPLAGPVYVEGAEPGDVLAVTLRHIRLGS
jgi:hypothetical protein